MRRIAFFALTIASSAIALAVLTTTSAYAGQWTEQVSAPTGTATPTYDSSQSGPGHVHGTWDYSGQQTPGPISASISGPTTYTFTWQPAPGQTPITDPPPPYVILQESASATATGAFPFKTSPPTNPPPTNPGPGTDPAPGPVTLSYLNRSSAGSGGGNGSSGGGTNAGGGGGGGNGPVNNAHGFVKIGDVTVNAPSFPAQYTAPDKWEVKDSSSGSVSVTSPAMSAEVKGDSLAQGTMDLTLTFNVGILSVRMVLGGTTKDATLNDHILIGQVASASIVLTSASGNSISRLDDIYNWDATGALMQTWLFQTPQSVQPSWTQQRRDETSYRLEGIGNNAAPSVSWYWNDAGTTSKPDRAVNETVHCTYSYKLPDGQGLLSIDLSTAVDVLRPSFIAQHVKGFVQENDMAPLDNGMEIWAGPTATMKSQGLVGGMNWLVMVTTPSTPVIFGKGTLAFIQLITPNSSYTTTPDTSHPTGLHESPYNGHGEGLDNTSFYENWSYQEDPSKVGVQGDSPGIHLEDYMITAQFNDSFVTYLLYQPPGGEWVPLAQYGWSASGSNSRPSSGHWADYPTGSSAPQGMITPANNYFDLNNAYPMWTSIKKNGSF